MLSSLKKIQKSIHRAENGLLILILISMILVAVIQIVLRNGFETGLLWGESLVRVCVLWTALLGAMIGARHDQHIKIDVITRFLSDVRKAQLNLMIGLITTIICLVVAYYSLEFVLLEYEDGGLAFAQVPNWLCESIIPIAFLVLAVRFFINAMVAFMSPQEKETV